MYIDFYFIFAFILLWVSFDSRVAMCDDDPAMLLCPYIPAKTRILRHPP